jgi:exopolysaccharide biosynthesis polyprenyl glycosylphosphotransferase
VLTEPTSTTPRALGRASTWSAGPDRATPVVAAPAAASRDARLGARLKLLHAAGGPAACTVTAVAISHGPVIEVTGLVLAAFAIALLLRRPLRRHTDQLPLMRHLGSLFGAALAGALLVASDVTARGLWLVPALAALCAAAVLGSVLARRPLVAALKRGRLMRRVAVIGPDAVAHAVAQELVAAPERGFTLVGRIAIGRDELGIVPELGSVADLERVVVEHAIDLLILAPEGARPGVLDDVTHACLDLPVRMVDLTGFCERIFGHVPVTQINSSWFRFLMHPTFRREDAPLKRVIDLVVAGAVALVAAPLIAILVPLVRRDGGPAFFSQTRIGEGGRAFTIHKLRTMAVSDGATVWTTSDDPRITPLGRFLRRTHLDELPQVLNVLRGDMSLVGPRPEQPSYVARLEREIPYYSRRHLIKPGITGWAQVRCGYAGTTEGSAWKMCHDLYYVKHRSVMLDLLILGETARTLFADRQYPDGEVAVSAFLRAVTTPAA